MIRHTPHENRGRAIVPPDVSQKDRRQSHSMYVPMGEEMGYLLHEEHIADLLYALRAFRDRLGP
jgi:hypothetical protein